MRASIFFPFFLYACGSETPAFVEIPEGIITLSVDETSIGDGSEPSDEIAQTSAYTHDLTTSDEEEIAAATASQDERTASTSGSTSRSDESGKVDAASVAKACAPHVRGLAQNIRVVDGDAGTIQLKISPNTAIAFKVAGHQTKLNIQVPAGHDIPAVCFFVSGTRANVSFSSSSRVEGFAYIGRGDQSNGSLTFLGGSPVQAHADLKGHHPILKVQGLDSELCQQKGISCNP